MEWVFLRHEATGGETLVPDDESVLIAHEARGWVRDETPAELDPDAPNSGETVEQQLVAEIAARAEEEAAQLKGTALDEALEDADLPKSGKADEKRARLAEHQVEVVSANNPEGDSDA